MTGTVAARLSASLSLPRSLTSARELAGGGTAVTFTAGGLFDEGGVADVLAD
jgi:hypothetical protein